MGAIIQFKLNHLVWFYRLDPNFHMSPRKALHAYHMQNAELKMGRN